MYMYVAEFVPFLSKLFSRTLRRGHGSMPPVKYATKARVLEIHSDTGWSDFSIFAPINLCRLVSFAFSYSLIFRVIRIAANGRH